MRQKAYLLASLADFCVVTDGGDEEEEGDGESKGQYVLYLKTVGLCFMFMYVCIAAVFRVETHTDTLGNIRITYTRTDMRPQDLFVHAPTKPSGRRPPKGASSSGRSAESGGVGGVGEGSGGWMAALKNRWRQQHHGHHHHHHSQVWDSWLGD